MTHRSALLVTAALIAAMVALVPLGGLAAPGDPVATESNESIAPGQQVSAVVEVGQSELQTDVEGRAFGQAVANADSPAEKARVIKQRADELDRRMDSLERGFERLEAARDNGSLSEGAYRARVTGIAAELQGVSRMANATANASAGLPSDVLKNNGVDVGAIEQLSQRASELGGQEVAEIARGIAGPNVGRPAGPPSGVPGPPVTPGEPPTDVGGPGNQTDGSTATDRPDA